MYEIYSCFNDIFIVHVWYLSSYQFCPLTFIQSFVILEGRLESVRSVFIKINMAVYDSGVRYF
jgi:hypothetical protein